jgi:hypothetical protein
VTAALAQARVVSTFTTGTTNTVTITGVTAGNLLTVQFIGAAAPVATQSLADSNGTVTPAANPNNVDGVYAGIYYVPNANSGSHTFTLTTNVNASGELIACEWTGVVASSPADAANSSSGTSTGATASLTTTNANDLVIAVVANSSGSATTGITDPPTNYTSIYVQQDGSTLDAGETAFRNLSSSGAQSIAWTWTAGSLKYFWAAASFKLSAGSTDPVGQICI